MKRFVPLAVHPFFVMSFWISATSCDSLRQATMPYEGYVGHARSGTSSCRCTSRRNVWLYAMLPVLSEYCVATE